MRAHSGKRKEKRPAALSRKSTRSAAGRPTKDEATTRSRDKLLQTAIEQFAKHGFDGVSTGEIAAAAGFSQAIIHYHFGSKDQLWRESMTYLMHDLDARFPLNFAELRDLGPLEQLRVIVRRFIAMSEYSTELSSMLIRESIADSNRLKWLVERHFQKRINALDNIVKSTVAAGLAKELPTFLVTHGILLASSFLFCLSPLIRLAHGVDLKDAKVAAAIPDVLLDLFLNGLLKR